MPERKDYDDIFSRLTDSSSLAYDVSTLPAYEPEEYEVPKQKQEPRAAVRPDVAAAPMPKQSLAPMALVGYLAAAVLLIFSLMARIQLTTVNAATMKLNDRVITLQKENDLLCARYETVFNMKEIESYARDTLKMSEPGDANIRYIDAEVADRAVVLGSAGTAGLIDEAKDFLGTISEYFGRK